MALYPTQKLIKANLQTNKKKAKGILTNNYCP